MSHTIWFFTWSWGFSIPNNDVIRFNVATSCGSKQPHKGSVGHSRLPYRVERYSQCFELNNIACELLSCNDLTLWLKASTIHILVVVIAPAPESTHSGWCDTSASHWLLLWSALIGYWWSHSENFSLHISHKSIADCVNKIKPVWKHLGLLKNEIRSPQIESLTRSETSVE
jgi:hypothetical protein